MIMIMIHKRDREGAAGYICFWDQTVRTANKRRKRTKGSKRKDIRNIKGKVAVREHPAGLQTLAT
jgi:hypothetical protein